MPLYIHQPPTADGVLSGLLLLAALLAMGALAHEVAIRIEPAAAHRMAVLIGATLWTASLVALTELLSLVHALAEFPLAVSWLLVTVAAAASWWRLRAERGAGAPRLGRLPVPSRAWLLPGLMACVAALQAGWLAVTAYTYAPNNYDALTYHLPRALHWLQERSSGPFATNTDRQVQFPPLAEYVVAQLHLAAPDDSLANFVQWFGMILAALAVTEIARRLGAQPRAQAGAALLAMALPIGIGEAATTQNDFVLAGWLAVFAAFGLGYAARPGSSSWALLAGLSLGLALLTKSTAYIYAAPILALVGGLVLAQRTGLRRLAVPMALGAVAALAPNLGQYWRDFRIYRSPLGSTAGYHNDIYTPAVVAANAIRNLALQVPMGGPLTPLGKLAQGVLAQLYFLTGFSPTDPRITFRGSSNVFLQSFWYGPDFAGNLIQTALVLATLGWLAWSAGDRLAKLYAGSLVAAYILLCGYLKFQIWGNRILLPLLVLWSPAIVAILLSRKRWPAAALPLAVIVFSLNWVAKSHDAPQGYGVGLTRTEYYAAELDQPQFAAYRTVADWAVSHRCGAIGLSYAGDNVAEYPLWAMLEERGWSGHIEHVDVTNATARWADPTFHPCAVIADHPVQRWSFSARDSAVSGGYEIYLGVSDNS